MFPRVLAAGEAATVGEESAGLEAKLRLSALGQAALWHRGASLTATMNGAWELQAGAYGICVLLGNTMISTLFCSVNEVR